MATQSPSGRQLPVRLIVAAIALVVLAILVFQNAQTVSFDVLLWTIEARLIWMLMLVALLGFVAGLVLPRFRA